MQLYECLIWSCGQEFISFIYSMYRMFQGWVIEERDYLNQYVAIGIKLHFRIKLVDKTANTVLYSHNKCLIRYSVGQLVFISTALRRLNDEKYKKEK